MTREDIIDGYMINEKYVIAEMLYDTITKYEKRITELEAPKSCDGCKWHVHNDKYRNYCNSVNAHICIRYLFNDIEDYYEPKDK